MIIAIIIIMAKIGSLLMVKVGLHYPSQARVKFEFLRELNSKVQRKFVIFDL